MRQSRDDGNRTSRDGRRNKSSIPFPSSSNDDDAYGRASRNAAAFDAAHLLGGKDTIFSSWRTRQMAATKRNPIGPHARSPPKVVKPTPERPPPFFPPYALTGKLLTMHSPSDRVLLHDGESAARMRRAGRVARRLLDYACHPSVAAAGRTTEEVDGLLHAATLDLGAYPSPLNYHGFPKSVCSSVNEVVCHGIPDRRPLEVGDVVSFDVSCYVGGVHGDNCATIVVGDTEDGFEEEFSWGDVAG